MKLFSLAVLIFITIFTNAQSGKSIHLQAIARNESGIILPNKQIALRLSIVSDTSENTIEYQEIKSITTNALGLFFVNIGVDEPGKVITIGNFEKIQWQAADLFLQVEIDPNNSLSFTLAGIEKINYVPLAIYADKAHVVDSVVPIELGGTGVSNSKDLIKFLNIDKVNNTPDSLKPISIATNIILNEKLKKTDTINLSNRINLKLNSADTIKLSNRINAIPKFDSTSLSSRINSKISIGNISLNDITSGLGFTPVKNEYGSFYDTSKQTTTIATATAVKFYFQLFANKITITNNSSGNPTRITVSDAGVYLIHFRIQCIKSDIGNDEMSVWVRRNGSGYFNTNQTSVILGSGIKNIVTGSYEVELNSNDYIELYYSVKNANSNLVGTPATTITPSRPATPTAAIHIHAVN